MAGYSPTPTARKLGIGPEGSVHLVGAPAGWSVPDLPDGVTVTGAGHVDAAAGAAAVVIGFVRSAAEVEPLVAGAAPEIWPDRILWVAWPRRAGGHRSDVTDEVVRAAALPIGLVDTKVAAIDEDWSGLKVVWRVERRAARPSGPGSGT